MNVTLTRIDDNTYRVSDLEGTVTQFGNQSGTLMVTATWTADDGSTSRYQYDTTDKRTLIKRVVNPVEPGVGDCTTAVPARGCEVLEYEYATATTASASALGDVTDQVRAVKVWSFDPDKGAESAVEIARYAYDADGRLRETWDPRLSPPIKTHYAYDAQGRVVSTSAAGQLPWHLDYGATPGDDNAGRLLRARRAALKPGSKDQVDGETATNVVYNVPLTRAAGGPHDLDAAAVRTWGQKDFVTDATAVFDPESEPGVYSATAARPGYGGYTFATTHYLNASGQETNTATRGGHVDSKSYDEFGNVVWTLEATYRELALGILPDAAARIAELNLPEDPAARANLLASTSTYSRDGLDLIEQLGPITKVALESDLSAEGQPTVPAGSEVLARARTVLRYDEGKPDGATYHLETSKTVGARVEGYPDADTRTTRTGYAAEKGGTSGWKLKKPTSSTNDAGTTYTVYDDSGRVLKSLGIGSDGADARAVVTSFYTAGGHPDESACGNRPEWAGQACITRPGGAITGHRDDMTDQLPVKKVDEYTRFGEASRMTETVAGKTRLTRTEHDGIDRVVSSAITSDVGVPIPTVTTEYDPVAGQAVITRAGDAKITRTYDALGRMIKYADADGGVTFTEYDRFGNRSKVNDNTGASTSFAYDRQAEPRGMVTTVTDSVAGAFGAAYSPDGQLVKVTYPGGITRVDTLDTSFNPVGRVYTRDTDGQVIHSENVVENTAGQWIHHAYTGGSKTYTYDKPGRLTSVQQITANNCTTRTYAYDNRTNRTNSRTFAPAVGGNCRDENADNIRGHAYDSADRVTDEGYIYDLFGRTAGMPNGAMNGYYVNDLVAIQEIDNVRQSWTLDPSLRFRSWSIENRASQAWIDVSTKINHYADDSDEPRWTAEEVGIGAIARNVLGPDGDLAATTTDAGVVRLQLTNLHGDVASTIDTALTSPEFLRFDEFGVAESIEDQRRYGWLGGKQRSADALGGMLLMGVRLYSPAIGRFLQVDPVEGGNANSYDYCFGDPVNCVDLDGRWSWRRALKGAAIVGGVVGALACGASIVCGLAVGATAAAAGYAASHYKNKKDPWRWKSFAKTTATGGALGGAHAGVGRILGHSMKNSRYGVTWNKARSARGTDFRWGGKRVFGIHSHRISGQSRWKVMHYHRRGPGGIKNHRPWQGRW